MENKGRIWWSSSGDKEEVMVIWNIVVDKKLMEGKMPEEGRKKFLESIFN